MIWGHLPYTFSFTGPDSFSAHQPCQVEVFPWRKSRLRYSEIPLFPLGPIMARRGADTDERMAGERTALRMTRSEVGNENEDVVQTACGKAGEWDGGQAQVHRPPHTRLRRAQLAQPSDSQV